MQMVNNAFARKLDRIIAVLISGGGSGAASSLLIPNALTHMDKIPATAARVVPSRGLPSEVAHGPSCPGPGRELPMPWEPGVCGVGGPALPFVSFVCRHRLILQPIAQQQHVRQIRLNIWEEHKRRVLRTFQTSAGLASR